MSLWTLGPGAGPGHSGPMSETTEETGALKTTLQVDEVAPVKIAPRDRAPQAAEDRIRRCWLIDFAPGTEWPEVDVHATEERYYVLSGEVIEERNVTGPVRTSYSHRAAATGPAPRREHGCSGSLCCPADPHRPRRCVV